MSDLWKNLRGVKEHMSEVRKNCLIINLPFTKVIFKNRISQVQKLRWFSGIRLHKTIKFLVFGLIIHAPELYADIGSDMMDYFNQLGTTVNATAPGVFKSQAAGFYSGGGIALRNRTKTYQIATLQLPNIRAGCGGIDLFTGAFSFISSQELVAALKNIGSNAISYAFMLAMKTMAPSVQSVIAELQEKADMINQASINSCEAAATLVGGLWPKHDITSKHICSSMSAYSGGARDWVEAKHGCNASRGTGKRDSVLAGRNDRGDYKNVLGEEYNVAWSVIKNNHYLVKDMELAELCMTMSGTIISYNEGDNRRVITLPGKADDDDVIRVLFEGGQTKIYHCNETNKCLKVNPVTRTIQVGSGGGFVQHVHKMLVEITNAVKYDNPLTDKQISFISNVKLPIYKLVNVLAAYKRSELDLTDYTDIISIDLVHHYISEILDVMVAEASNLRKTQVSDDEINSFITNLNRAKAAIRARRMAAYEEMSKKLQLIEGARIYEDRLQTIFEISQRNS